MNIPNIDVRKRISAVRRLIPRRKIPENLTKAYNEAISHYPELNGVRILLRQKKMSYTMQAWPEKKFPLKERRNRAYVIYINNGKGKNQHYMHTMSHKAIVGMFGHELAHIVDYNQRNTTSMLRFTSLYVSSQSYRKRIERKTDFIAIKHGLAEELYISRKYILDAEVSKIFRGRLDKYYLSLHEIGLFVKNNKN